MIQFSIGLSALQAAQQALAVAGNNLANASTPGYHRQIAEFSTLDGVKYLGYQVGTGVKLGDINRAVSDHLEAALTRQYSLNEFVNSSLTTSTQIENTISDGTTSPSSQLEALLNQFQALSSSPTSGASLKATLVSAQSVANAFNLASSDLSHIRTDLNQSISSTIDQINDYSKQIAQLNIQITSLSSQGGNANDLMDKRAGAVNELAKLVGVDVKNGSDNQISVFSAGLQLVSGPSSVDLVANTNKTGTITITAADSTNPLPISGGQLGGFLSQRNGSLADYQQRLDTLARQVIVSFNSIQSTGTTGSGGFTQLIGTNPVTDTTANLNAAGLAFPPSSGSLFVGITDVATGKRTLTEVTIDPLSQSLQDVATAISGAVPHLHAMVSNQLGTMTVATDPGYTFDFAGGFEATPQTTFTAGTTIHPQLGGAYTGTKNDNYTVKFLSSGTVGITSNLQAQVTNQTGSVIATLNLGQGYQVGQPIVMPNGQTLTLDAGTVASGDSFSTPVIANSDTAGLLNALGLNTLFSGSNAGSIAVNATIAADPTKLATSRTGQPGDTSNLKRFTALADAHLMAAGTQTFSQFSQQMVSDIGVEVNSLTQQQSTNQALTTSISNQQQSVSGVDTNEELANVLQYQQMFATAGKYIALVNAASLAVVSVFWICVRAVTLD